MIGALVSNLPAGSLKGGAVAGGPEPGSEDTTQDREGKAARESLGRSEASALRISAGPLLTSEAVLALQEAEDAEEAGPRPQAATDEDPSSTDDQTSQPEAEGALSAADSAAGGAAQSQDKGEDEDSDGDGLNEEEEKQVEELKKRDQEVRAHEQAHARTGGAYAGAPSYTFQQGPDGKRYAIGGEVQIDTAKERTPEATVRKMQIVIRAATAPAEPSSQDLKVAQQARSQLAEAQAELREQKTTASAGGEDEASANQTGNAAADSSGPSTGSASRPENREAASAYETALQRVSDAQSLFSALVA